MLSIFKGTELEIVDLIKNSECLLLRRPDISSSIWNEIVNFAKPQKGYVYLCSSGTSNNKITVYEISHESMLGHARELNKTVGIDDTSSLLVSLPPFFMGGLSIIYRAIVSGTKLQFCSDYSTSEILSKCEQYNSTHLSLVPYQLEQILSKNNDFPKSLKNIFIGGGSFSNIHHLKNNDLFLKTYGMSELCSQVATGDITEESGYPLLPWIEAKTLDDRILLKSPFHFSRKITYDNGELNEQSFEELSVDGFFITQDHGVVKDRMLFIKGRIDRLIKCRGRLIDLDQLEVEIEQKVQSDKFIVSYKTNSNSENEIVVITTVSLDLELLKKFNVYTVKTVDCFLRTASGKLIKDYYKY